MTDAAMKIVSAPGEALRFDLVMDSDDLAQDMNFETAVVTSLFSWARDADAPIVSGFWADSFAPVSGDVWGSRLRRIWRSKNEPETVRLAKEYAEDALAWLVDDLLADAVVVMVDTPRNHVLRWKISITLADGTRVDFAYEIDREVQRG